MAIALGGFMADQQRQEALTQSSPGNIESARSFTSASAAKWQQEKWDRELEKEYEAHLRNLRQYICELLIKNQQLRWLVESATNHRYEELGDDHDQTIARNRS
jgi:hypothetical protein